ncbi:MAG: ATP-dependent Clp protease ATP-binding subunit ClpA [Alphaproteobacteria bacterium]|nr:ATP-dependent Clp protease ATP-binding subunit ClpA [Alphaproteobacteria bacterium]
MPSFSYNLNQALHTAFALANERDHGYATLEHLLLTFLDDVDVQSFFHAYHVDVKCLRRKLTDYVEKDLDKLVLSDGKEGARPTLSFQRVIQRALLQVQDSGIDDVTSLHVLVTFFSEKESHAVYFLQEQDISANDIINYVGYKNINSDEPYDPEEDPDLMEEKNNDRGVDALESCCVNLNQKAQDGKIDSLVGRDAEIHRMIQILCRRCKNNPLLIGDPGVGKTAIIEGLALQIVKKSVPEVLHNATIFQLDTASLLAGTRYRGDFEKRLKAIVRRIEEIPGAILFIDEIHTMVGAGATSGSGLDASNLLKPLLQGSSLRCIGLTTHKEYRQRLEKDSALVRRFQRITINEPSIADTLRILRGLKPYFEAFHKIRYTDSALKSAVYLSARHIHDRKLPDKAIDVIDETGASKRLLSPLRRSKTIGRKDIESTVATMACIPSQSVSKNDIEILRHLGSRLKERVFGQDKAVEVLTSAIKLGRAGLREVGKPMGSYLFSGPTGVGKTEIARQISSLLSMKLLRFDMSEYMERHAVSRLIGAPPGYVGFEEGGLLTEGINQNPHCVLLLDEIEKAHPDMFNLLLQVMDHGKLTDNNGKQVDFSNVILIMTSNAGASDLSGQPFGFTKLQRSGDDTEAIKRLFTPEFRNRLDAIIPFDPLLPETMIKVVEKFLLQLKAQLADRNVKIRVTPEGKTWLCKKGYDPSFGARPLSRIIQEFIKKPLADEILFGKLIRGGCVMIKIIEDETGSKTLGFEIGNIDQIESKPEGKAAIMDPGKNISRANKKRKKSGKKKLSSKSAFDSSIFENEVVS